MLNLIPYNWYIEPTGVWACCVRLLASPWTLTLQALLSMEFSKQEYWSWLPFPPPGDLSNPGILANQISYISCIGRQIFVPLGKPLNQLSIQLAIESTIHIDQTICQLFDTTSNLPFLNQIYMNRLALEVSSLSLNLMMRQTHIL